MASGICKHLGLTSSLPFNAHNSFPCNQDETHLLFLWSGVCLQFHRHLTPSLLTHFPATAASFHVYDTEFLCFRCAFSRSIMCLLLRAALTHLLTLNLTCLERLPLAARFNIVPRSCSITSGLSKHFASIWHFPPVFVCLFSSLTCNVKSARAGPFSACSLQETSGMNMTWHEIAA